MNLKAQTVEAIHHPTPHRELKMCSACLLFALIFLFAFSACDGNESVGDRALRETRQQCIDDLTLTFEDKGLANNEYDSEPGWEHSASRVETLYEKSFFFLLQKETSFKNKTDRNLAMVIRSIYTCSGVPPHLTLMERTHFSIDERTDKVKLLKTEVLEEGKLVPAPTREDQFFDVLYRAEKREKQQDKGKGHLTE